MNTQDSGEEMNIERESWILAGSFFIFTCWFLWVCARAEHRHQAELARESIIRELEDLLKEYHKLYQGYYGIDAYECLAESTKMREQQNDI